MDIQNIQTQLVKKGYGPLDVDNIMGPATRDAVKRFQAAFHLEVDGKVGPQTIKFLFPVEGVPAHLLANIHEIQPWDISGISSLKEASLKIALSQNGVRELSGKNDGPAVEAFLASCGLGKGYSWCMAFNYWCTREAAKALNIKNPLVQSAGVLDQWGRFKGEKVTSDYKRGDIFILDLGEGHGHTGRIVEIAGGIASTIEGNTNNNGSANGDGVYKRERKTSSFKGAIRI